jgi:tripartite-type tricarboxylate transporter receptor subunit TctC
MLHRRSLLAAAAASLPLAAAAQTGATGRPLRILVPFPGGGVMDTVARLFAPTVGASLASTVVIENRPGGGTVIATQEAARAAPDGRTVLMAANSFAINPSVHRSLPYDIERDFVALTQVAVIPHMLVVHPSVGVTDLAGLIARGRSAPGAIAYASYGPGTSNHLSTELLKGRTGADFTHVPYRGAGQWLPDLVEGRIQMTLAIIPDVLPAVREGRLRALAVAHPTRIAAAPDVPTFAELGFDGFFSNSWFGFLAPAGIAPAERARLAEALRAPLAVEEVRTRLAQLWIEPLGTSPDEFAALLRTERAAYAEAVRLAGLTPQ